MMMGINSNSNSISNLLFCLEWWDEVAFVAIGVRFHQDSWEFEEALVMEDIGLLKQCWQWFRSQKDAGWRARNAVTWCRDRTGVFIDRHWPMVCRGCSRLGSLLRLSVIFWKDSALRGFQSFIRFGPVMLLLIMWSCFLSLTSMYCLVYVLVSMVCLCFNLSKSPFLQFWVSDLCVYVCYPAIYF